MSRTDAHAPFHVRAARREATVVPVHRCAGRECDLPELDPGWSIGRIGCCYWEFAYTGVSVCSCWMCHWHRRREARRAAVRTELRGAARDWNGGEVKV
ncbi:Uncharacterised protein [Mycobacteroides abscessus subsp. massiliense]|uniref:hypothetical protein n=1 Tax=Mycobacteroides abscessus TaxID=36809 RepID=UPI000929A8E7|nr:hypothetical protein [Mycobacteroides abscessus]SHR63612.1 Uncharacterised protein [Mycobacteroides abscessus subsp. abscessus]SKG49001.1 Uncharacterised protein [Mycobacteroides abscessus subsp. massiliense]SKH00334.1 Uncharacterised protein [Mycobacteroides abscessus subsp. massiliense]SKH98133.1 Uncharacterised protein [Mycobacteroides abscessus subsp. massiliense]SKJ27060.1 Uncharacterised protein [Mycobacteroides abscessus subsp. massiliense]